MLLKFNWIKFIAGYFGFSTPSYVILFVTARCNMSCKMCFYWENIENADAKNELTLEEISKISKSFGQIINLAIGGGEPFIRSDLDLICKAFYDNAGARFFNIPTNGSFPAKIKDTVEKILKSCPNAQLVIELSLDGVGKDHDAIRQHQGAFEKLLETSRQLAIVKKQYPFHVKVSSVFSSLNQDKVKELFNYVRENLQFDDFDVSLMHDRPVPKDRTTLDYVLEKFSRILKEVEDYTVKSQKSFFAKMLFTLRQLTNQDIMRVAKGGRISSPCTAIRNLIVISETGEVFPCETLKEKIGQLRDSNYDIKKILRSEKARFINKKYKIRTECSCNWGCAIFNNKLYDPKMIAPIILGAVKR